MSIPGSASPLFFQTAAAADAAATGPIKSLRFNRADTAYLNRTPSSDSNRKTFTIAVWAKNCAPSTFMPIIDANSGSGYSTLYFGSDDTISVYFRLASQNYYFTPSHKIRDYSAWYHIVLAVDTTQATASNRVKLYINGTQVTDFNTAQYLNQDANTRFNADDPHWIGGRSGQSHYLHGYLADFYMIDGSALDPTSFGAFDDNGVWQAAAYSGTYGTNGFHLLDFANESTVGHDSSGNNNDFSSNNISTSAGAGNDVLFDAPANGTQSDTGAGGEVSGNYCTLNPLDQRSGTLSNGNLEYDLGSGTKFVSGTIAVKSGKWYWEAKAVSGVTNGTVGGRFAISQAPTETHGENGPFTLVWHANSGIQIFESGSYSTALTGTNYSDGDTLGLALDADSNIAYFYKNGSLAYTYDFSSKVAAGSEFLTPSCWNGSSGSPKWEYNFGQRAFAYSARSGHKCLVSTNLPTPTVADGSDYFNQLTYVGNQTSRSITGLGFSPDLVIVKNRERSAYQHYWVDSVRGGGKNLYSASTEAEHVADRITTLDSDGFTLSNHMGPNYSGEDYIAHCWDAGSSTSSNTDGSITTNVRANTAAGFSICSYTGIGDGSTESFGHGLNTAPELVIIKNRDSATNWAVYHKGAGAGGTLQLNSTGGKESTSMFDSKHPSSSVVYLKENSNRVNNPYDYIAYCFAPVAGYSAMGSYEGNADSGGDGPFCFTGFAVKWLLIKGYDSSNDNWKIFDTTRSPYNVTDDWLAWNNANAETTSNNNKVDLLSNGFKIRTTGGGDSNLSTKRYIYYAIASNPFQANGGLAR